MRFTLLIIIAATLAGCATSSQSSVSVDLMFRETGNLNGNVIRLTKPALVNEVNGAFKIHTAALMPNRALNAFGHVMSGGNKVFVLEFTDYGDLDILRTDDMQVSLRAEFGPDGKVLNALLGAENGVIPVGFGAFENDTFISGSYELLYEGPDIVVGRFDLQFKANRVRGNFRAPRIR